MLDKQYNLYSVDTGHFYSNHEKYLHDMNCKYRRERNYVNNKLPDSIPIKSEIYTSLVNSASAIATMGGTKAQTVPDIVATFQLYTLYLVLLLYYYYSKHFKLLIIPLKK